MVRFLHRLGTGRSGGPFLLAGALCTLLILGGGTGCRNPESDRVQSYLKGHIQGPSPVGKKEDHSGFRVLVIEAQGRTIDTLGRAVTDPDGTFSMTVRASERGIYPLTVWGPYGEKQLATTDYVVADGDSGTLGLEFPLKGQSLRVRSPENEALAAYRNTTAQHRRVLQERLRADSTAPNATSRGVRRTSSMLWSLQKTFPGTYASELGAAESLSLLTGWDDSLVVQRARLIEPSSPYYVEAVRCAYHAAARRQGRDAALQLLTEFESRALTSVQRAALQAIRVRAFVDSQQSEAARSAAQTLRNEYAGTKWADWAKRIGHEVRHLQPGTRAPNVHLRTTDGNSLSLRSLRGRPVVLEYFRPGNEIYHLQLGTRDALYRSTRADSVAFIAISVEPDTLVYEAFTRARVFPGQHVIAERGMEDPAVTTYNIVDVPTRVLIDAEGRLVGRYSGTAFFAFQEDLAQLLRERP